MRFYGNDIDYVNELIVEAYDSYLDEIKKYPNTRHNCGPTILELAEQLKVSDVTVRKYLSELGVRIILLGGEFQRESQVMVGPLVKKCAENFFVDKFFFGTDGFNAAGAMAGDMMRAEAVRHMAQSARRAIILTESKKFSQAGVVPLLSYKEIDTIYTDEQIPDAVAESLSEIGVALDKVSQIS